MGEVGAEDRRLGTDISEMVSKASRPRELAWEVSVNREEGRAPGPGPLLHRGGEEEPAEAEKERLGRCPFLGGSYDPLPKATDESRV